MNDIDFRFQRHLKVWEEQSKTVKRSMFVGLFFGLLLLLNVLTPFVNIPDKLKDTKGALDSLNGEKNEVAQLITTLDQFKNTMKVVEITIGNQPWMNDKENLIKTLREIKSRSPQGGNWPKYQKAADNTIQTITKKVRDKIIQPLENPFHQNPKARKALPELSQGVDTFHADMDNWEQDHLGKRWYETFIMKETEMKELTDSLKGKLDDISELIRSEQSNLDTRRQKLASRATGLENDIQQKENQLAEELNREMDLILPSWLRGILSIEQMIQLFPLFLLGLVVYVLGTSLALTSHYEFVLEKIGFSQTERSDPSISSIWTLTHSGRLGTALTLLLYLSFTLVTWFFFEWGSILLDKCLTTNAQIAWVPSNIGFKTIKWIGRFLFVAALAFIIFSPFYLEKKIFAKTK